MKPGVFQTICKNLLGYPRELGLFPLLFLEIWTDKCFTTHRISRGKILLFPVLSGYTFIHVLINSSDSLHIKTLQLLFKAQQQNSPTQTM